MTPAGWVIIIIAIAAIGLGALIYISTRRSKYLRRKFGPEYDRAVNEHGNRVRAERELEHRSKRVERFNIRSLTRDERERYAREWEATQGRFVDDPQGAVAEADDLVHAVMKSKGYPVARVFDENVSDLSVDHPLVVQNYRAAHDIAVRAAQNKASTEDLRVALKHYRALYEDLLGDHVTEITGTGAKR
jgi:hypothetical protein